MQFSSPEMTHLHPEATWQHTCPFGNSFRYMKLVLKKHVVGLMFIDLDGSRKPVWFLKVNLNRILY